MEEKTQTIATEQSLNLELTDLLARIKENQSSSREEEFFQLMQKVSDFYKNDMCYAMAQFYFEYGSYQLDNLEQKLDVFGQKLVEKKEEEESSEDEEKNCNSENVVYKDQDVKIQDVTPNEAELARQAEKESQRQQQEQYDKNIEIWQIIWENLDTARQIVEKHLKEIENQEIQTKLPVERNLARIYKRLGDFQYNGEMFTESIEEFQKAVEIYIRYENNSTSRNISELFFMIGSAIVNEAKAEYETRSNEYFIKSCQVLENILAEKLQLPNKTLNPKPATGYEYEKEHLQKSFLDTQDTIELKKVLTELYHKIEDNVLQADNKIEESKILEQEKQTQVEHATAFAPKPIDQTKVINLGTFGNLKRKKVDIDRADQNEEEKQKEKQIKKDI